LFFVLAAQLSAGCGSSRLAATKRDSLRVIEVKAREIPQFFVLPKDLIDVSSFVEGLSWFRKGVVLDAFPEQHSLAIAGDYAPLRQALLLRLDKAKDVFEELVITSPLSLKKDSVARKQLRTFLINSASEIMRYLDEVSDVCVVDVMMVVEKQLDAWIVHLQAELDEA